MYCLCANRNNIEVIYHRVFWFQNVMFWYIYIKILKFEWLPPTKVIKYEHLQARARAEQWGELRC